MQLDYIKCGNAIDLLKDIPDNSINLIVTDPPYEITGTDGGGSINKVKKLNKSLQDLEKAEIHNGYDIELYGNEFIRVMKEINIYLWCNKKQIPKYLDFYVTKHI